jgi:hypothetical protein
MMLGQRIWVRYAGISSVGDTNWKVESRLGLVSRPVIKLMPGTNRWYDKLQIIVCSNGEAGINFEHTGVDGHTVLRYAADVYTELVLLFAKAGLLDTRNIANLTSRYHRQSTRQLPHYSRPNPLPTLNLAKLTPLPQRNTLLAQRN